MCWSTLNGEELILLDTDFLKLFLSRCNILYPSHILLKTPRDNDFLLIESTDGSRPAGFPEIPVFEHDCVTEDPVNKRTFLWLKYSDQVYVVAAFAQAVSLDDYTVNILYHLLLPVSLARPSDNPENRFKNIVLGHIDLSQLELSPTANFELLINKILEQALFLVQADAGMLWFYDSEINKLVCKAYKGCVTEQVLSTRLDLGEGHIGKTFLRGTPRLYSRFEEVLPDIEDYSVEKKRLMWTVFGDRRMDSAYLRPLFVNKQIEYILNVYRLKENHPFSASDIEILELFAGLIELGMAEGKDRSMLRAQVHLLEKCNQVYSKLTSLSVNNSGILNIVRELKRILNIPVLVINLVTNELYPRQAAFDRELFIRLTQLDIRNDDTFLLESADQSKKYCVYPILAGSACLGYMIVRSEENELQINQMILEIGRTVIALELSKTQSMLDISFKRTAQHFLELINLNDPLDLARKCAELGMDSNANYAVVVLAIIKENNELQPSSIYRLIANIKRELAGIHKLVFSAQEKITVLLSIPSANGMSPLQRQINEIIAQAQKNENLSLCAGMGSLYSGAATINKSYREAQNALMYQVSRHSPGLLQYSDMGVNQLFINLTSEEATTFLSKIFTPLREKTRRAEYLETTLIAYIESNCSMVQTAKQLFIHTNTLYQRLKKIEDSLHISLKKPDDLLQIQLACYLRNIYPDIYNSLSI
jgi:sugar diacid utilization regulator